MGIRKSQWVTLGVGLCVLGALCVFLAAAAQTSSVRLFALAMFPFAAALYTARTLTMEKTRVLQVDCPADEAYAACQRALLALRARISKEDATKRRLDAMVWNGWKYWWVALTVTVHEGDSPSASTVEVTARNSGQRKALRRFEQQLDCNEFNRGILRELEQQLGTLPPKGASSGHQ